MHPFPTLKAQTFLPPAEDLGDLYTPALAINLPAVRQNIARVLEAIGDPACWRPHIKTTKLPEIWSLLIEAGIDRFKCATTHELEVLLALAPDVDVLFAHHPSPAALKKIGELAASYPAARVSVLIETPATANDLPPGVTAFVDINPGMNRTGIPMHQSEQIMITALACGDRLRGLHFYDGHIRDGSEDTRRERAHANYDDLLNIDASIGGADEIITSGTTTFIHALAHSGLVGTLRHTVSPGTVVLHDVISQRMPEIARLGLEPAAAVLAHVVSQPTDDIFTLNAGNKSVSADAGDPCCVALEYPNVVSLHPSEEHLPMRVLKGTRPNRGDVVALIPEHVCPTVNLARYAILKDEARISIVKVAAAGHDAPFSTAAV